MILNASERREECVSANKTNDHNARMKLNVWIATSSQGTALYEKLDSVKKVRTIVIADINMMTPVPVWLDQPLRLEEIHNS